MPYIKKTIPILSQSNKEHLCAELGLDVALVDDASLINIFSKVIAAGQTEQYSAIEYFTRQAFPNLAEEEGLRQWGLIKQVEWITSRISTGYVDITGTNGSTVAIGTELSNSNGDVYTVTSGDTIASGVGTILIASKEGGLDKNIDATEEVTFVSTPTGIDSTATVDSDGITGGTDTWTLEQYREAVISSFSEPPRGGSAYDYEFWTRQEVDPINVWIYSYSNKPAITKGDVEVYFLIEGYTDNIPPIADRNRVLAYINTIRPVGMGEVTCPAIIAEPTAYTIEVLPLTQDVQDSVTASLQTLHDTIGPGGTITTGQMQRAVSDSAGVEDFKVTVPSVDIAGATRANLLTVGTITWS